MASFGEELKRERELRDISLKEIAEATKISIRFLEALECNNFDILPGGIFNRGFIRAYARFIGVDGEEMVNSYLHELSMQEKKKSRQGAPGPAPATDAAPPSPVTRESRGPAPSESFFRPERSAKRSRAPRAGAVTGIEEAGDFKPRLPEGSGAGRSATILWVAVVITVLIGAAAVTFNQLGSGETSHSPGVAGTAPGGSGRPQEASTIPPTARAAATPETNLDPVEDDPVEEAPQADPPAREPEPAPVQEPVAAPRGHSLWVRATEFNYIRIECGEGVALDQELLPNQSRTVNCVAPGRISALNAGALQYTVDGGPIALLGEMGLKVDAVTVIEPPAEDTPTETP